MVNAQQWIDKEYPKNGKCQLKVYCGQEYENFGKRRDEIKHLDITYQGLTGSLTLEGFTNLESFNDIGDNKITKLDVSSAKKIKSIFCSSIESTNEITELIIGDLSELENLSIFENKLTTLNLLGCPKLKTINCSKNNLTSLKISNCSHLEEIECNSNKLTNLEELNLVQRTILKKLNIGFNQFSGKTDVFSHLINLEELRIDGNDFYGSLESLKNLSKLQYLGIDNTNIDKGLEYLPVNLKRIACSSMDEGMKNMLRNAPRKPWYNLDTYSIGIKKIEEIMEPYSQWWGEHADCDYQAWCKDNQELIRKDKKNLSVQSQPIASSSKKSKNAKQKEKLSDAQNQIKQLQFELEQEKLKNIFSQKEHDFYKNFFDNYFNTKKQELETLKNSLSEEEQESLETYIEAYQESNQTTFVKKQLKKSQDKLNKKLTEEKLTEIVNKEQEIKELETQLNDLSISQQLAQIQIPPK